MSDDTVEIELRVPADLEKKLRGLNKSELFDKAIQLAISKYLLEEDLRIERDDHALTKARLRQQEDNLAQAQNMIRSIIEGWGAYEEKT